MGSCSRDELGCTIAPRLSSDDVFCSFSLFLGCLRRSYYWIGWCFLFSWGRCYVSSFFLCLGRFLPTDWTPHPLAHPRPMRGGRGGTCPSGERGGSAAPAKIRPHPRIINPSIHLQLRRTIHIFGSLFLCRCLRPPAQTG